MFCKHKSDAVKAPIPGPSSSTGFCRHRLTLCAACRISLRIDADGRLPQPPKQHGWTFS
jgi:hypothetical protein